MVLHAGIVCYEKTKKGKLVIYNTEIKETITKDVMTVGPGDNDGVDELFKSIQSYFNAAPKGCLCVCLGNKYDSEIRKKFIDVGKGFGFTKVGITDWLSADYCDLVSATDLFGKVETLKGYIWIFCGKNCRIWRKDGDRARFVKEIKYEDTVESLQQIKKDGEEKGKTPDLVIYGDKLKPHYEQVKNIFGRDKVAVYSDLNQEHGVLIKARIMGKDKSVKKYSTETLLEQFAELKINGNPIASARMWQSLPYNEQKPIVGKPDGATHLEMFSYCKTNKKYLPDAKNFTVKFNIDPNGICSVDFDTGDETPNSDLKNQGKKYSSNNSLPTDPKPKFHPRAPGQQQHRPRFNPAPQSLTQTAESQLPQQQPRVVRTNLARQNNSYSTSSLASATSATSSNSRGGRGGERGAGRGAGRGGNRGGRGGNRGGGNQNSYANLPQDPIPGLPPQLQQGYQQGAPVYPQTQQVPPHQPYVGMHQPQFQYPQPPQPPYYGNPSYPTSPQPFGQNMGYPNGNFPMNPGFPPQYGSNLQQPFQNMNIQGAPPPYPGNTTSINFNEKQIHDYQKPAMSFDSSNPSSVFPNQDFPQGNNGKEKGSKKNAKR